MINDLFCSAHDCGNRDCSKNSIYMPHGIAVTVTDFTPCPDYRPRYKIFAVSVDDAKEKIEQLKAEHPDLNTETILHRTEVKGLTVFENYVLFRMFT